MAEDHLTLVIDATHRSLEARSESLFADRDNAPHHTDALVGAAGRHLAAIDQVVLPMVGRRVEGGGKLVGTYLHEARRFERALVQLKGRVYGESHAAELRWSDVRSNVRAALREHNDAERNVIARLAETLTSSALAETAERVFRAEVRAPTRPHPYLPHSGLSGTVARKISAVADRFWDATQGRVVPAPVAPRRHSHDSLLAQYLVAHPHFDQTATLLAHDRSTARRGGRAGR